MSLQTPITRSMKLLLSVAAIVLALTTSLSGQELTNSAGVKMVNMTPVYPEAVVIIDVSNPETVLIDRKDLIDYVPPEEVDNDPRIFLRAKAKPGVAQVTVQAQGSTTIYLITVLDPQEADSTNSQKRTVDQVKTLLKPETAAALKISFTRPVPGAAMILEGTMPDDLEMKRVIGIAMQFTPQVLNYMSIAEPLQIRVKCDVLEVNEGNTSRIGMTYRSASDSTDGLEVPMGISTERIQNGGNFLFLFDNNADLINSGNRYGFLPGSFNTPTSQGFPIRPRLSLVELLSHSRILQSPTLTVMNGQPATVRIGQTVRIPTTTTTTTGVTTAGFEPVFAGVEIRLLPLIPGQTLPLGSMAAAGARPDEIATLSQVGREGAGADGINSAIPMIDQNGLIRLHIISQVSTFTVDPTLSNLPISDTREVATRVTLRDGEALILGGLINDDMRKNAENVPFLSKIPIIGEFFKQRDKTESNRELVFVITPNVIHYKDVAKGDTYTPHLANTSKALSETQILPGPKPTRISAREVLVRPEEASPEPSTMLLPRPNRLQLPEDSSTTSPDSKTVPSTSPSSKPTATDSVPAVDTAPPPVQNQ